MRTNNVKSPASTAGRGVRVFGWILVIMGVLFIASGGFGPNNPVEGKVMAMLFFFGGGVALILQGEKTRKIALRYEEERASAINRQMNNTNNMHNININMADIDDLEDMLDKEDMEDISEIVSKSLDIAKNTIPQMMKQGTFTTTTTYSSQVNNRTTGRVTFSTGQTGSPASNHAPASTPSPKKSEPVVVACKGCGANNKVMRGSVGECEFCGSPISAS